MQNISDVIAEFILQMLGDSDTISISRNELALYFDCAPSQINYVLSTRFSLDRGYVIESRRGGGGFISLVRLTSAIPDILIILNEIGEGGVTYARACQLLDRITEDGIIAERDCIIIKAAISDKALLMPMGNKNILRASVLNSILRTLISIETRTDEIPKDLSQAKNNI